MRLLFDFDPDRCSACGACAIACMDQNDVETEAGQQPYRKVYQYESRAGELVSISIACLHCPDAPCVAACPAGVLYKDPATGLTCYDNTNCIGCHSCSMACPYGAPVLNPATRKMSKCDACADRLDHGLQPICVESCPQRAIEFGPIDGLRKKYGDRATIAPLPDANLTKPSLVIRPPKGLEA